MVRGTILLSYLRPNPIMSTCNLDCFIHISNVGIVSSNAKYDNKLILSTFFPCCIIFERYPASTLASMNGKMIMKIEKAFICIPLGKCTFFRASSFTVVGVAKTL